MAISRGLTEGHFNWKTKCKFAMGILNRVLEFDSREVYHKLCNLRRGLVKYELFCLSLGEKKKNSTKTQFLKCYQPLKQYWNTVHVGTTVLV